MRPLLMHNLVAIVGPTHGLSPVEHGRDGLVTGGFGQVPVVRGAEHAAAVLGTDEGQENDIGVDAAHEDADDDAVLIALGLALGWEGEAFANRRFDGRGGGGDEIAELIRGPDDEGAEGAGRQLHEVDGNDTPGALHAELLEEGCRDDALATDEGVRVQKGAAENGDDDDGEAATEDLRRVTDERAACHGTEIGYDLSNGDGICREIVLVRQHRRVQILRSV